MFFISLATLLDLNGLVELESELFTTDRISRRQFRYLLTKGNSLIIKAHKDGKLLGYMVLLKRNSGHNLRIYSIGIAESARKQGIADRFVKCAEWVAMYIRKTKLTLEVCEKNEPALHLYFKTGFSEYGQKKSYYQDGCTALLLTKRITLPNEGGHDSSMH